MGLSDQSRPFSKCVTPAYPARWALFRHQLFSTKSMSVITNTVALARLLSDARRSPAELEATITERLKKALVAAAGVPRHREVMRQAGYDPRRDFGGLADLAIMPVMTKTDLKRAPESFVQESASGRIHQFFSDHTSGSTGIPLTVYKSPRERDIQIAKWLRALIMNGYRPTDKVLSFTSPGRLAEGRSVLQRFGLLRRKAVDYTLSAETLTDELFRYRPDVVYGVRTTLQMVAEELDRRGIEPPPIKLLVSYGEVIDAQTKEKCRQSFGVEVTEIYGSVEMGVMAYQKRGENVLSLIEDCTLFEFLDEQDNPAKPGEMARIVVTDLHGGLMPFIRYDIGDLATYSLRQNASGETVRVIDRIIGRQDDVFHLPDGRILTFIDFYDVRYGYDGLQHIRITQHSPLGFLVEVVADPDYFQKIREDLAQRLRSLSALPLEFELRQVEQIAPDPGGKRRMLVCELDRSFPGI